MRLPARIQKDDKAVHINEVEFSPKSEIFTDSEIDQLKALAENQDLTAEDLDNLIKIINQQYLKKKGSLNFNTSANLKFSKATISGFTYSNYKDYNLAVGLGGHRNFKRSVFYGSLYSTNGIIDDHIRHESKYFTKVNADGYYVHYLPKGIIATLRAGGQYSPHDIAYIEQYQIGGISSVRGYSESLLLAASSYFVSAEMLFPIPFLPQTVNIPFTKDEKQYRLRDSFKFAVFCDQGAIFPHEGQVKTPNFLMSVGAGIRMAISKYITARFYIGIPIMNTRMYQEPNARIHFDLIISPF